MRVEPNAQRSAARLQMTADLIDKAAKAIAILVEIAEKASSAGLV